MSTTTMGVARRSFLKWSSVAAGATALVGAGLPFIGQPGVGPANAARIDGDPDAVTKNSACLVNCGSRCPIRLQMKDGVITRVLPDATGSNELNDQQIRACVRGRSARQRLYNPDRLKTPLRRKPGTERGAGQWEEISWDEALTDVANAVKKTIADYGNDAIYWMQWSGVEGGNFTNCGGFRRLLNCVGGFLGYYGTYSVACMVESIPAHYGTWSWDNSYNDVENASLLVMWGDNPLETRMSGGGWTYIVQQVKKKTGIRVIVIDPRYSETAANVADEWVPIRPGTDAALAAGMVHVMVSEGLHDQGFLDKYCVGFDEEHMPEGAPENASYLSYIMGKGEDGVEKTPEWAARITGIPADKIRSLAREIAGAKPCAIRQGWGIQRNQNGETACRAPMLIANVTGNVGISGGGTGVQAGNAGIPVQWFDDYKENPVEVKIPVFMWTDAIVRGKEMTAKADGIRGADRLKNNIKMMFVYASNTLINQHADINKTREIIRDTSLCETIVGIDNHMTPSMEMCDIVLPETTWYEREDFLGGIRGGDMGFAIHTERSIEPLWDTRDGWDMAVDLAKKLGVEEEFTEGRTKEDWIAKIYADTVKAVEEAGGTMPSHEEMKKQHVLRISRGPGEGIAYEDFRADPEANPLETPSGKIEIFSQKFYEASQELTLAEGDRLPALPEHVRTYEGAEDVLDGAKYPLQCLGHHTKAHVHSTYTNVEWLAEANRHHVWISQPDAKARGISNDDMVRVFNDRGTIELPAFVTPRIMPGVCSVPQGQWNRPDEDGVDKGGAVNTLTTQRPTPYAKGTGQHTNLVDIALA